MMNKKNWSLALSGALAVAVMAQSGLAAAALGCLKQEGLGLTTVNQAKQRSCNDGSGTGGAKLTSIGAGGRTYEIVSNLKKAEAFSATMRLLTASGADLNCSIQDSNPTNASVAKKTDCFFPTANPATTFRFVAGDGQGA